MTDDLLQVASLGSGSAGNSTLIRTASTTLLLDCGFTLKETVLRCEALGIRPAQIDGILISHEHGDHVRGLGPLARKHGIPVWMTYGTHRAARDKKFEQINLISAHVPFVIGDISIEPFPTPHDAAESCQYVFRRGQASFACVTDLGVATPHIVEKISPCTALLVECNYDEQMLRDGPYPASLQARIRSNFGHLGNVQAAMMLQGIDHPGLQTILLGHLSEKNNLPQEAHRAVASAVSNPDRIRVLSQHEPSDWFVVSVAPVAKEDQAPESGKPPAAGLPAGASEEPVLS